MSAARTAKVLDAGCTAPATCLRRRAAMRDRPTCRAGRGFSFAPTARPARSFYSGLRQRIFTHQPPGDRLSAVWIPTLPVGTAGARHLIPVRARAFFGGRA